MPAIQLSLPLPRPPRLRSNRRPFTPRPADTSPYRLPHDVHDQLTSSLAQFRNRDSAFALAAFLARFWSTPTRITMPFPIDRRALTDHADLGLTEARVRGAIRALEEAGYLDRVEPEPGKRYQRTEDGLHRRAMLYRFGPDYLPSFLAANKRAAEAKDGRLRQVRPRHSSTPSRPLASLPESGNAKSPIRKSKAEKKVLMGDVRKLPSAPASNPRLEAALERWKMALREERQG